jgi:hypothetical protein
LVAGIDNFSFVEVVVCAVFEDLSLAQRRDAFEEAVLQEVFAVEIRQHLREERLPSAGLPG